MILVKGTEPQNKYILGVVSEFSPTKLIFLYKSSKWQNLIDLK
jgi:hypothetical protein